MLNKLSAEQQQEKFLESIEGLGDVLVVETQKNKRTKTVVNAIDQLTEIVLSLFELQKNDPIKFERLMLHKDYFEIQENNKKEAGHRLYFFPEKYLVAFSTPIYQLLRVHDIALKEDFAEVSRATIIAINRILAYICITKTNDLFVKLLLQKIYEVFNKAIKQNAPSLYPAAFEWYTEIVFNFPEKKSDEKFNMEYLPLLDSYLIALTKLIIQGDYLEVFRQLILSFVDGGIHIFSYDRSNIWEVVSLLRRTDYDKYLIFDKDSEIHTTVLALDKADTVNTLEKLNEMQSHLDQLKKIVLKFSSSKIFKEELNEIYKVHKNYLISDYKFNNAIRIFFGIGAYCWYKKRIKYIDLLWYSKQPLDSDATWVGDDIVPENLEKLMGFFLTNMDIRYKFDFGEGHTGSEKYLNEYFLLLLAKFLAPIQPSPSDNKYYWNPYYSLPRYEARTLSDISYSCKKLAELAKTFSVEQEILDDLHIVGNFMNLFTEKVEPFLLEVVKQAESLLQLILVEENISSKKVDTFKEDFLDSFEKGAVVRGVFQKNGLVVMTKKEQEDIIFLGFNQVYDKEAFIENWHIQYTKLGEQYGTGLATSENTALIRFLEKNARVDERSVKKFFEDETEQDFIIFSQYLGTFELRYSDNFMPHYRIENQPDIPGFAGYFIANNRKIPIVEYSGEGKENGFLVANIKKTGQIVQLPANKDMMTNEDQIFFEVKNFSSDNEFMDQFIGEAPPWLKQVGTKEEQVEYLKKKVLLKINERFCVKIAPECEIYMLKSDSK